MNAFPYDLEATIQDADFELAEVQAAGNRMDRLAKRGICTHGWIQGPPGPIAKPTSVWTCLHCGKQWASEEDHNAEYRALMDL